MENETKQCERTEGTEPSDQPKLDDYTISYHGAKYRVLSMPMRPDRSDEDFLAFIRHPEVAEVIKNQIDWQNSDQGRIERLHELLSKARRTRLWR